MVGTTLTLIVVPIVVLAALGTWLGIVMYAGEHPEWKAHRLAREAQEARLAREAREGRDAREAAALARTQAAAVPDGDRKQVTPHAA